MMTVGTAADRSGSGRSAALALSGAGGVLRWGAMMADPAGFWLWPIQGLHALTFAAGHLGAIAFISRAVPDRYAAAAQGAAGAMAVGGGDGARHGAGGGGLSPRSAGRTYAHRRSVSPSRARPACRAYASDQLRAGTRRAWHAERTMLAMRSEARSPRRHGQSSEPLSRASSMKARPAAGAGELGQLGVARRRRRTRPAPRRSGAGRTARCRGRWCRTSSAPRVALERAGVADAADRRHLRPAGPGDEAPPGGGIDRLHRQLVDDRRPPATAGSARPRPPAASAPARGGGAPAAAPGSPRRRSASRGKSSARTSVGPVGPRRRPRLRRGAAAPEPPPGAAAGAGAAGRRGRGAGWPRSRRRLAGAGRGAPRAAAAPPRAAPAPARTRSSCGAEVGPARRRAPPPAPPGRCASGEAGACALERAAGRGQRADQRRRHLGERRDDLALARELLGQPGGEPDQEQRQRQRQQEEHRVEEEHAARPRPAATPRSRSHRRRPPPTQTSAGEPPPSAAAATARRSGRRARAAPLPEDPHAGQRHARPRASYEADRADLVGAHAARACAPRRCRPAPCRSAPAPAAT